ncbi:hypothetical protein ACIBCS_10075 [Streptomyces phaeochromogenes]|jgi:hypothetical protein|uniref:hypothetical protein n=1 Tax=Streptomyces phaeochromogenes TaxID=1923 RepID=UPI0033D6E002
MTATPRICRFCDEPITDLEGAVFLWHEPGLDGSGWDVYAHTTHTHQAKPPLAPLLLLARIRARAAGQQ